MGAKRKADVEGFDIYKLARKHAKAAGFRDKNGKPLLRPKGPGDWSLPGYNYIGPGNPTNDGYLPVDDDDMGASDHDGDYGDIQDTNQNPYLRYSNADEKARQRFGKRAHGYGGKLGKAYFTGKKWVTPGINEDDVTAMKKQKLEQEEMKQGKRKFDPAAGMNIENAPKKQNLGTVTGKLNDGKFVKDKDVSMGSFDNSTSGGTMSGKRKRDDDGGDGGTGGHAPTPMPAQPAGTSAGTGVSPSGLKLAAGMTASAGTKGAGETGVDPWGEPALRAFPDTKNAILPYYAKPSALTLATGQTETAAKQLTIRLNSIYDCITTVTHSQDPTPADDAADGSINTPIMRDFYSQIYKYWTVVGMDYKVRFWAEKATITDTQEVEIFCYHHGQQVPPFVNGTGTTGGLLWKKYRLMHPNMHCKTLRIRDTDNKQTVNDFDSAVTFEGSYDPMNVINQVEEDEFAQTWHKMTEVPKLHEKVTFIIQRSERSAHDVALNIRHDIELVYRVQFKDAKSVVRYPFPAGDITFTDYAVQTL